MREEPGVGQLWGIILAGGEGTRVRTFLSELCGGRGIKQFCAVIGRRSMLEHTLARVEMAIPRQRILVIVSQGHLDEAARQLAHWPQENVIIQPEPRDTTAGILLPLAYITHRDPAATVAIFPSDHFILDERRFMDFVRYGVVDVQRFPWNLTLLGVQPDGVEDGYGWIEPATAEPGRLTRAVVRFWEKPTLAEARTLWQRQALWNTFVCIGKGSTLWDMVQHVAPDVYTDFLPIRRTVDTPHAQAVTRHVYQTLRAVNFSSAICEPGAAKLRVLPINNVGWSDWGSVERIIATVEQLGKKDELLARLNYRKPLRPQIPLSA